MKTRVLCSSIFFIADSVLRGDMMALYWSIRGAWGIDFRGYLGSRGRWSVRGRWKETEWRTLRLMVDDAPFNAAFFAVLAFASLLFGSVPGRGRIES